MTNMTKEHCLKISQHRFESWAKNLSEMEATPIMAIGIVHNHKEGGIVLCTLENEKLFSKSVIKGFLQYAADRLV